MKILKITLIAFILHIASFLNAGEGMWIPLLLKSLNEAEMQSMGMKLSAEDIYSVNRGSLKDAIVHFGGFCTGEIISGSGLLLTNHHCGYGQIQSHSSVDNNMLKNGFWAKSHKEELTNPGLFARFIDEIKDVSKEAMMGVKEGMSNKERQSIIDINLEGIKASFTLGEFQELIIRPFYNGNQYYAFVTTVFNDVRLVGTPPESIGKFGSDTDNWVWPRHTGDFSLFRIYASPDNQPADYSPDNVPYKPKHFLPISLDGVEEDDFTMVFGFPGRTNEYLPSPAIEQVVDVLNPAKINIRDKALKIMDKYMRADEGIKIQYASKFARIANYWKKWIGESLGLKKTGAIKRKLDYETEFVKASGNTNILNEFKATYRDIEPYALTRDYYNEVALRNIEILGMIRNFRRLITAYEENGETGYENFKARLINFLPGFYKNYNEDIDKEVFGELTELYASSVDQQYVPDQLKKEWMFMRALKDHNAVGNYFFSNSIMPSSEKVMALLEQDPKDVMVTLKDDPLYKLGEDWEKIYAEKVSLPYNGHKSILDSLQRVYMKSQMDAFPNKRFYPDANSTMRVTYGKVNGYTPKDAVYYTPVTYLDGAIEKYVPGDYEFDIPSKLLELYEAKNYGQYADSNGKVPICFIGTNHTTGGNSGSPAIDAHGNLIGLNFDRAWEGTMSDMNYDASICRNIMVDARYILFIIDKFAGASHIIDEMKLVHPKKK